MDIRLSGSIGILLSSSFQRLKKSSSSQSKILPVLQVKVTRCFGLAAKLEQDTNSSQLDICLPRTGTLIPRLQRPFILTAEPHDLEINGGGPDATDNQRHRAIFGRTAPSIKKQACSDKLIETDTSNEWMQATLSSNSLFLSQQEIISSV